MTKRKFVFVDVLSSVMGDDGGGGGGGVVDIIWTECMVQCIVYSVHMHSSQQTTHIFIATFLQTHRAC